MTTRIGPRDVRVARPRLRGPRRAGSPGPRPPPASGDPVAATHQGPSAENGPRCGGCPVCFAPGWCALFPGGGGGALVAPARPFGGRVGLAPPVLRRLSPPPPAPPLEESGLGVDQCPQLLPPPPPPWGGSATPEGGGGPCPPLWPMAPPPPPYAGGRCPQKYLLGLGRGGGKMRTRFYPHPTRVCPSRRCADARDACTRSPCAPSCPAVPPWGERGGRGELLEPSLLV